MFATGLRPAFLIFLAPLFLALNYSGQSNAPQEGSQPTPATAAKHLTHSLHVIVPHGGHGFGGLTGLECIDNLMSSFIEKGTTAGLDTSCVSSIRRDGFLLKLS